MSLQLELNDVLPDVLLGITPIESLAELFKEGATLTSALIERYSYLISNRDIVERLQAFAQECVPESSSNDCKHSWIPAGHPKNKDRIHNKGNGKGKYQAYKCELCHKFKRRYLK